MDLCQLAQLPNKEAGQLVIFWLTAAQEAIAAGCFPKMGSFQRRDKQIKKKSEYRNEPNKMRNSAENQVFQNNQKITR